MEYRNNNILPCWGLGIYLALFCSRLFASYIAQTVLANLHAAASNPLQMGLLAIGTLLSFSLDRRSRAAQAAASISFRLASSLMVRPYFKSITWTREAGDWLPWIQRCRGSNTVSPNPSVPSSFAGSEASTWSGKDISSFRIPDKKLKPRTRSSNGALSHRRSSGIRTRSSGHPSRDSPFMQRSRSVPVDPTSPLSPKSPLTFTLGVGRRSGSRYAHRTTFSEHKPAPQEPADSMKSSETIVGGDIIGNRPTPFEDQEPLSPSWSSQATASISSLTAKISPSLDYLRRWPSSPVSWRFRSSTFEEGSHETAETDYIEDTSCVTSNPVSARRSSIDGPGVPSSRHYTHGQITAMDSGRRAALERYSYAARIASNSTVSGHLVSGPGHVGTADSGFYSALASLGLDGDCPQSIRDLITDEHLLQLGAALGESASESALQALAMPPAYAERGALCGAADIPNAGWEPLTTEIKDGVRLHAWRKPLRKGLYVYKTVVQIEGVDADAVRPFHLDDQARALWDDGALSVHRPTPVGCTRASRHAESCLHSYVSKFPGPMAPRRYNYARRVWHRPSDGGCYVICQSCDMPDEESIAAQGPRAVQVLEFTSAAVIRAIPGGAEVSTMYFEDSQVRPGLAKVGVPKGLWPFWSKYAAALLLFAEARAVTHRHPHLHAQHAQHGSTTGADNVSDDGEVSDDELYGALVELKAARRAGSRGRGGALDASSRWARRLIIAGAVKMMHVILATR